MQHGHIRRRFVTECAYVTSSSQATSIKNRVLNCVCSLEVYFRNSAIRGKRMSFFYYLLLFILTANGSVLGGQWYYSKIHHTK
jgi:hypothetical protein